MATFTWDARELLILETVNDGYESGDLVQNSTALAEILGLSVDESERTVRALYEADYLDGSPSLSTAGFDLHLSDPRSAPVGRSASGLP